MSMRAFGFPKHGGPEVLEHFEIDEPEPGPGELAVRIEAVALNHLDIWVREGWPGLELALPHVAGTDCAGVVESLGDAVEPGVDAPDEGTPVVVNPSLWCGTCPACLAGEQSMCEHFSILGEDAPGALTERIVVPARNVVARPAAMGAAEAAAAPLVFQTAWRMAQRAGLRAGETCLVPGAGGGVASAAIQIAKHVGARVIATTSSKEKGEAARALGADEVVLYTDDDWGRQVYQLTGKRGVDVVLDSVGAPVWAQAQRFLAKGGRLACCGVTGGHRIELDARHVFWKQLSFVGSTMGNARQFDEVMSLVFDGRLSPVVDQVFRFDEAKAAVARLEAGEQFGKVVVELRGS